MTAPPAPTSADKPHWHDRSIDDVLSVVATSRSGLSATMASERLKLHGPNRLPEPPRAGPLLRFLRQFNNLLIYVLVAAAAVTAALGHLVDTGVILAVVLVNAAIGFVQEGKAERALSAIKDMLAPEARVLRDGARTLVPAENIVPGDVVLLEPGDRVPADLRVIASYGLRIQEAVLTGESVPVEKATEPVEFEAPLGDRRSMAFSGALVAGGTGRGVVVASGSETEIGRISGMLETVETTTTPLLKQMEGFARTITLAILAVATLILLFGYFASAMSFSEIFMAVVGLSVAAIPEGLPAILTVTLAIGVQGMAARNAIVRRLPAIEALGSVSVICSDKTGTLTKNEMTVASVATAGEVFGVTGSGYGPHGGITLDDRDVEFDAYPLLGELARGAVLCNDADIAEIDGHWSVTGDPMEGALVSFAWKAGHERVALRQANPQTDAIPFDAAHRFMATLHHDHEGGAAIHVKGAPERVIAMCRMQHGEENGHEALDGDYWHRRAEEIAAGGQRVLAIATCGACWAGPGGTRGRRLRKHHGGVHRSCGGR
ncbi:MAG: HAD-IC family P-type ATPase [Pseudomonadota bacterium]